MHAHTHAGMHESTSGLLAQTLTFRPNSPAAVRTPAFDARYTRRSRSPNRSSAPEHGYQSPWQQFEPTSLLLMQQLDVISKRPLSLEEFHQAVCGASEHDIPRLGSSGRSTSHFLSTMARCVTVMLRLREEGDPAWETILSKILACAWRVVNKFNCPQGQCAQKIRILYDFMSNRCDDAAVRILSDRAILASRPPWTELSSVERAVSLSMLNIIDDKIQRDCVCIKGKLGSS